MKVLFLVQKEQRAILDRLYEGIAASCECDIRWLTDAEQDDLRGYFKQHVQVEQYDRILFFLRFKRRSVRFASSARYPIWSSSSTMPTRTTSPASTPASSARITAACRGRG